MLATLKHPGRVAAMVLAATLLNLVPITVPGGALVALGSFVSMPLVLTLPAPWAILAAAVPATVTVWMVGHPFMLIWMLLEAVWLVAGRPIRKVGPVLQDLVFWMLVGVPLTFFVGLRLGAYTPDILGIITIKNIVVQQIAVGVAVFLVRHTRIADWFESRMTKRMKIREIVFRTVFLLVVVPLAFVGIGFSVLVKTYSERSDRLVLQESAQRFARQMEVFLETHEGVVNGLANMIGRRGGDPQILIEETRRVHPEFITMLVADAEGSILHTAADTPQKGLRFAKIDDREYFREARDRNRAYVSGVFRGRGFGRDIIVAISAPIRGPGGEFAGIVQASLEVHRFARAVAGETQIRDVELLVADARGRVIYGDPETGVSPLDDVRYIAQAPLFRPHMADKPLEFDHVDTLGDRSRFVAYLVRNRSGLAVIAQRPLTAGLEGIGWIMLLIGALATGLGVLAFSVARAARNGVALPLEEFARGATRQAALRNVEPIENNTPDAPQEIAMVYSAFNNLAVKLSGTYMMLRKQNEELDRRVVERTRELEGARAEAVAASESKSVFLAMTSHEIRTPLNAIIGLADALEEKAADRGTGDRLRTIKHAGRRLLGVVNDLLDLSRVEAGKLELRPAPLELGALCDELHGLFALRAEQLGLTLTFVPPAGGACWIETDGARLQQVLVNLIGNAMKFTKTGGITLRIEITGQTGDQVGLSFAVIDTGPGISVEEQARLFQPYSQLPGGEKSGVPGTGLGLSISSRLVGLLGGSLGVRSEVGRGSEFFFGFQARRCVPPVEAGIAPVAEPPAAAARTLRVLAADDNEANREVLASILEAHCARLEVVDSAQAAIDGLLREKFDVALIDLEMIDADGYSVARTVRAWQMNEASRGCRLIAFSAHHREQMWSRCAEAGFDDYVEKPIDRAVLMASVRAGVAGGA